MPTSYTGVASNVSSGAKSVVSMPADGDVNNGATFQGPLQSLADYGEFLVEQQAVSAALSMQAHVQGTTLGTTLAACETGFPLAFGRIRLVLGGGTGGAIYTNALGGGGWVAQTGVGTEALQALCSNGSLIVAVGNISATFPVIATSPDGVTWTRRSNTYPFILGSVCWFASAGLFAASTAGAASSLITSPDGITWTTRTVGATVTYVTAGNGVLVAWGGPTYYTSTDGINFTARTSVISGAGNNRMKFLGGTVNKFFTTDVSNNLWNSSDGINWTNVAANVTDAATIDQNGRICLCVCSTRVMTSLDGTTWRTRQLATPSAATMGLQVLAAANGQFFNLGTSSVNGMVSQPLITP